MDNQTKETITQQASEASMDGQATLCDEAATIQEAPREVPQETDEPQKANSDLAPQAGSDAWFAADSAAFDQAYPELDKETLFADESFLDYADGKVGRVPLATIYRGYCHLLSKVQADKRVSAARDASPGSLRQPALDADGEYYTRKQMQAMSPAFIEAHWDKVQRSLKNLSTKQA